MKLPTTLLLAAAIVAFVGYPAAFIYTLTTRARDERMRRALTTFAAGGMAIVGLLTIVRVLVCQAHPCLDCIASCAAYWTSPSQDSSSPRTCSCSRSCGVCRIADWKY
jgi:hypothetical protein